MLIKNFSKLTQGFKVRKKALSIINEGLESISPFYIFKNKIAFKNNILTIENKKFNLARFNNIYVIGFGKAAGAMAEAMEKIIDGRIKSGLVIDTKERKLKRIKVKKGTHPYLSKKNIQATKRIINLVKQTIPNDLVFCLISGGGSALFENPYNSFVNTLRMYKKLLLCGASIREINIVRKHISCVKGGQLAAITPAQIISLIFSDVIGDDLEIIASGPTVLDKSTVSDAYKIIQKYRLPKLKLLETPKDKNIFEKVHNLILLNNKIPLMAMKKKAEKMGYAVKIITRKLAGEAKWVSKKLIRLSQKMKRGEIYLAGGETTVRVKGPGKGGRNTELSLAFLKNLPPNILFTSIASDGQDNTEAAGALVDQHTQQKAQKLKLNPQAYLSNNDSYNFFQKTGDLIFTGPTDSNVADLILMLKY